MIKRLITIVLAIVLTFTMVYAAPKKTTTPAKTTTKTTTTKTESYSDKISKCKDDYYKASAVKPATKESKAAMEKAHNDAEDIRKAENKDYKPSVDGSTDKKYYEEVARSSTSSKADKDRAAKELTGIANRSKDKDESNWAIQQVKSMGYSVTQKEPVAVKVNEVQFSVKIC